MTASKGGIQSSPSRKLPSLFTELTTALVSLVTLVSIAGGVINYLYFSQQVQRDQQNRSAEYAEYLRDSLEWPLWNIDDELITKIGTAFAANPEMATLIVRDEEQRVIYQHAVPQTLQNRQVIGINHAGHPIGSVEFGMSLASYEERERQLWLTSLATIALLILLLIGAIRLVLSRMLRKPIDAMITATRDMVEGNYQQINLPAS